jgi:hypothetical protein
VNYRFKKELLSTEMDFLEKSCKNIKNIKIRKGSNRRQMAVTQTILERMENNMLKWYAHLLRMGDNT